MTPKMIKIVPKSLVQKGFKNQKNRSDGNEFLASGLPKIFTSKMPSRWPKNGPKMTPKWFKIAQIAQDSPKNKAL